MLLCATAARGPRQTPGIACVGFSMGRILGAVLSAGLLLGGASPAAWGQPPVVQPPPEPTIELPPSEAAPTPQPPPEIPEVVVVGEPAGVGAQGSPTPGDTPVVTATRSETPLSQTGSSVTVITAEQIQRSGQTNVAEVLRGVPGLDVVRQGSPGSVTSIFMRGANSAQTKVMLDGLPLNDPISPDRAFDFSNLAIDNIERIEIVRGPGSSLYGSDAIGGVINIITKRGEGPLQARLSTMAGAFHTANQQAYVSGGNEQMFYSFAGSYFDTQGFSAADRRLPGNTEPDGFRLGTISSRTGWTPYENFDVDVIVRYNRGTVEIDNGGGPFQDDPLAENFTEQTSVITRARYENFDGWWEQSITLGLSDIHRDIRDPLSFFNGQFNGQTTWVDWQHNFRITDWNTVTVGLTEQVESGSSTTEFFGFSSDFPEQRLRDTAVYVQNQTTLAENWFATVGVRQDNYSQAGVADTYRLTSLYRLPGWETGIRGSIGTGFKAPTLFQLFDPFSGNALLAPESSKGWDYGIEQPLFDNSLVASVTYFRNNFNNLIDFDPNTFQYFNIANAKAHGIELGTVMLLTELTTLTTTYTLTDTENLDTGEQLLRRPRHKAGLGINRRLLDGRADVSMALLYVGSRQDAFSFPAQRVTLPSYITVNTAGSYFVRPWCQLFGRIDNLFNEKYQEVWGFGTPGISAYGGVAITR